MYEYDLHIKTSIWGDFGSELPTHMDATHAILKIEQIFQNPIPRESDKNFDIPRVSVVYWFIINSWE